MQKNIYFDEFDGDFWPSAMELRPYFFAPKGKEWFIESGNDSAGIGAVGVDGTDHLEEGKGRIDVRLSLWGNSDFGMLILYHKYGGGIREAFTSKGDLSLLKKWVRTTHDDLMPIGLFIPFPEAWKAVKEFMETDGALPKCIEWVRNDDLPENTFPDPFFDENAAD